MNATEQPVILTIVYDLRDPGAWQQAHKHRGMWGKLFTDIHLLDSDHVVLVFRSGGERWSAWERVRLRWILEPHHDGEQAAAESTASWDYITRAKEHAEGRIAHYERRLAEVDSYEGAYRLFDDALEEFIELPEFVNDTLVKFWMLDPDQHTEDVQIAQGRAVGDGVIRSFAALMDRIGAREASLAKTEAEKAESEKRARAWEEQRREWNKMLEARKRERGLSA
jgi:hypothetical protein